MANSQAYSELSGRKFLAAEQMEIILWNALADSKQEQITSLQQSLIRPWGTLSPCLGKKIEYCSLRDYTDKSHESKEGTTQPNSLIS